MCGIAGELRFDGAPPSVDAVRRMVDALAARGPDGEGIVGGGRFALGHRRLAVIDPTDRSAQPMVDAQLGLRVVYNGALYEYRALRQQLEALGYRFVSDGDTEVVLKAFHAWGKDCVHRFKGMFAFAVVDDDGRAFIARDRMGIKPLYYTTAPGRLRFSSTLPALLAAGDVDTRIDSMALQQFLTLHGIVVAPRTILRGVAKLPPAGWMAVEPDGSITTGTYWALQRAPRRERTVGDWSAELREVLLQAVRRRLVADTEVGVLLSGGLDSSLIAAMLHREGCRELSTFSIGFGAVRGEAGDEFAWSDAVSAQLGTRHTKIEVTPAETLAALPRTLHAMSEPMVSHDCVAFRLLGETVRHRLKVVQCGQGADELFGGYHWHARLLHARGADEYAAAFCDRTHQAYLDLVQPEVAEPDHVRPWIANHFAQPGAPSTIDATLRIDAAAMLPYDPITRLDSMMMASGIEARVPFLDEDVVEIATAIPAELSVVGGKSLLKAVAREFLPHPVVERPKGYFPVPALRFIEGRFADRVRDWLMAPVARTRGIFRTDAIDALLHRGDAPLTPLGGSTLWQVAALEAWLQAHGL